MLVASETGEESEIEIISILEGLYGASKLHDLLRGIFLNDPQSIYFVYHQAHEILKSPGS